MTIGGRPPKKFGEKYTRARLSSVNFNGNPETGIIFYQFILRSVIKQKDDNMYPIFGSKMHVCVIVSTDS